MKNIDRAIVESSKRMDSSLLSDFLKFGAVKKSRIDLIESQIEYP